MRHAWLPIVLAALFGLRLPLCVYACLESTAAAPIAAAEAPCHGGGEEPAEAPPPATHECECDAVQIAVAKHDAKAASSPPESPALPFALAARPHVVRSVAAIRAPHRSPPPRDLLLLNATLLL